MHIIIKFLLLLSISFSLYSESEIELSLNSDSIWRGITQNNGNATLSAEINFALDNGFFSGATFENCCDESTDYPNKEFGYMFGYQKDLNKTLNISINYLGTNYPDSKIDNFDEVEFNLSFKDLTISYFIGLDNFPDYYEISYRYPFFNNSLSLSIGDFDSYSNDFNSNGLNYSLGVETLQSNFKIKIYYYYLNANGKSDQDDDGIVLTISKKLVFWIFVRFHKE